MAYRAYLPTHLHSQPVVDHGHLPMQQYEPAWPAWAPLQCPRKGMDPEPTVLSHPCHCPPTDNSLPNMNSICSCSYYLLITRRIFCTQKPAPFRPTALRKDAPDREPILEIDSKRCRNNVAQWVFAIPKTAWRAVNSGSSASC